MTPAGTNGAEPAVPFQKDDTQVYSSPTIYAPLFDLARREPVSSIQRYLSIEASKFAHAASRDLAQMVDKAYTAGLRDGYQQGVQHVIDQQEGRDDVHS